MSECTHSSGNRRINFTMWIFFLGIDEIVINTILMSVLDKNQSSLGFYINDLFYFYREKSTGIIRSWYDLKVWQVWKSSEHFHITFFSIFQRGKNILMLLMEIFPHLLDFSCPKIPRLNSHNEHHKKLPTQ